MNFRIKTSIFYLFSDGTKKHFRFLHKKPGQFLGRVRVKQKLAMLKLIFNQFLLVYSFISCCF